ncbi:MAG: hypothetical protein ABFC89_01550 [Methanospirillum sp.]
MDGSGMKGNLFRCAAGVILALLLAGSVAAADANNTTPAANQTPPAAWERTYGGLSNETLLSLLGSSGGGYQLVGSSDGNGTDTELYLVWTDANGTPLSDARMPFGTGGSPIVADRTADGGTIVVGGVQSAGPTGEDVALARLGPDGRRLWSRSYAIGNGRDVGYAVRPATDGGYFVAGTAESPSGGAPDLLLMKVGEDGGEVWHRALPLGAETLFVRDLLATPDGGYLVVGSTDANHAGSLDILLVKVSSGGNREWQRTYASGAETAFGYAIQPSPDGGWLLLGGVEGAAPSHAAVLVKVDTAGNEQWRKRLTVGGASTWGYALAPAGDGYAVAGAVGAPEGTRSYAARFDRSGNEVWNRTFAIGNGPSRALAVIAALQDRLVVGGEASRTTDGRFDLYLSSVVRPTVAPNATATVTPNLTANITATPNATPTTNATSIPTTAAPATTRAAPAPALCLIAVAGIALTAALRRR